MEKIPKEILSLAGEYAVASELCRRGVYAQLTLGTRKRTDLLIDTEARMLRIQVKAKNVRNWPFCKGISGEDIILVFVDYQNKADEQRPDFYILTSSDWKSLVKRKLSADISKGEVILNNENCPIYHKRDKRRKGYEGMDVLSGDIGEHKEQWDKIKALLNEKE